MLKLAAKISSGAMEQEAVQRKFTEALAALVDQVKEDPLADLCERLDEIGERDTEVQLLGAATHALGPIYKAHKWFVTRGDLEYTALWILYAVTSRRTCATSPAPSSARFRSCTWSTACADRGPAPPPTADV